MKIESGFSKFTADQWKNWVLYFSLIALRDVEVLECWRHYVLACRILCAKSLTNHNIKLEDALLLQFCRRTECLFGRCCFTPNMHLHCHLYECILDYGPLHSFWCFSFERYNGILGAMPNNNRSIESQLMQKFLTEIHSRSISLKEDDDVGKQLSALVPEVKQVGSVADTCTISGPPLDLSSSQAWTMDSVNYHLPKFSSQSVLTAVQRDQAVYLYAKLYQISDTLVDITSICFSYTSVPSMESSMVRRGPEQLLLY